MSPGARRVALFVALLATLVAVWFAPVDEDDGVALSARAQGAKPRAGDVAQPASNQTVTAAARTTTSSPVEVLRIQSREQGNEDNAREARLFSSTRWTQPVKAAPVASPAPTEVAAAPPQAPPLPFRALGRYDEAGQAAIFLQHLENNLVVRVGDTIAEQYKVESLQGTTLTLRYLPLNQLQTLEVGGVQ